MNEISELITNVGFPIVAFLLMYYQSTKTIKDNTAALREILIVIQKCHNRK